MSRLLRQAAACCVAAFVLPIAFAGHALALPDTAPEERQDAESTAAARDAEPRPTAPSASTEQSEEPEAAFKGEITVVGEGEPTLTVPSPELAAHELARVPGGAAFVDAEVYRRGRASTLKDALDFVPGVFVQERFGAEEARLSIRGSGLQRTFHGRGLKLLQDGVPLNLADGGFDFQAVEPLGARYVEVFRGPNGLQHGSSTLGGAINYVSPTGYEAAPAELRFESGAFGYLRGQAAAAGASGRTDYFATLTHFGQDGFRDHSRQSTQRFFGNLGRRLSEDRETRFYLTAVRTDSELPGSLTKAQLAADPSQAAPGNLALDQKRDFDLFRLANRTTFRLGADSRFDAGAFWSYKHLDHPIFQVLDQLSHDVGVDLRYTTERPLAGRGNRFLVGLAPAVGVLEDNRFFNVAGRRGARTARGDTTSTNLDLYTENRHQLRPGLALAAGLQLTHAARDFNDDFLANGDQTDLQEFVGVSPKLGLTWDVSPDVTVFANAARSFEPPSFGELANLGGDGLLQLGAQTATSVEAGGRGRSGRLGWDVVVYHAAIDGELLSLSDAQGNPLGTINADRTTHSGLEAGFELRAGRWSLRQVYTWSRFRFDGDPAFGDNQLAGMPEHFLRTELLYETPRGFYGGPNLEWVPDRYPVDHANTLYADDYAVAGFELGYRTGHGLSGFVEGKNLTDETYAATTGVLADARGRDAAQFLPGDGASVFAGLEYRW
jgi:iron complex outermembrane receptor protein